MSTLPRRGAYPALQHPSNGGTLSSEDNNVAAVPVVHPASGTQHNMVATSHPGGLKVAYRPYQWHEGLDHPKFRDSAHSHQSSHHQISRKANAYFSSAQGSAQPSSCCGKSAYENFARKSINNGAQERECSEQKGSNVNINTGQQERHLNVAVSVCTNSSAHQGDNLQVMKLTFPLQKQCSSVPKSQKEQYHPLLCSLLERGSYTNPSEQHVSFPFPSIQLATEKVSPVAEDIPPTDDQIQDFIAQEVANCRKILTRHNIDNGDANFNEGLGEESILQSDCNMPESNSAAQNLRTSVTNQEDVVRRSLTTAEMEQRTFAAEQALGDEPSKGCKANSELPPKSQQADDCATSSTKKHSSEYPQIMREAAATCTKNEDLSTVVLSAVSRRASHEGVRQNAVSVYSEQTDRIKTDVSENQCKEVLFVNNLKDPQYEDISDFEDTSPYFKNPQYEDVSEDESPQIENKVVERPLPTQVPVSNSKLLSDTFVGESYNDVQVRAQMETEAISDEEIIPKKQISSERKTFDIEQHSFAATDDGFEDILDKHLVRQTNHSLSGSPPSSSEEDETDDWIVIPISLSDLEFEPGDEDQESLLGNSESGQKEMECDKSSIDFYKPWPDSLSSDKLNEFDTFECLLKFIETQSQKRPEVAVCRPTLEPKDSTGDQHTPQNWSGPCSGSEDSCDTEDSCDYSYGSEPNRLAVPRQMLEKRPAPLLAETDDSASEKEGEEDGVTNVPEGQSRSSDELSCIVTAANNATNHTQNKTSGQKNSKKNDEIIVIDSDSEDEHDQTCKKKEEQKKLLYSGDAPCSQQRRHSAETVGSSYGTIKEIPSADPAAPQHWSKDDTQFKNETSEQLIEKKGSPEHVEHTGQKNSLKDSVINLDSDTEDDSDQNYKNATRKRSSFGTVEGSDVSRFQQKMHSSKTINRKYGTAEEKLKETGLVSAHSSPSQRQSKCHDKQPRGACSDLLHTEKQSGQPSEGGSERVQNKANRPGMSRRNAKKIISSGSEDNGNALLVKKNRHSTDDVDCLHGNNSIKRKKPKLSSEKLTKEQSLPLAKEAVSTSGLNYVIPRYFVRKSSQSPKHVKEYMQGTDSHEKKAQNIKRNKKGRFVSKQKPANDGHHSKASRAHVKVAKPRLVSKQLSLPGQEEPSTSTGASSFSSGHSFEARQSSASLRHWSRCNSSPSTLAHPVTPTKDPLYSAATHLSARNRVTRDWKNSHFPTRRDKKSDLGMDADLQTTDQTKNDSLCREARPGQGHCHKAPRWRHSSHDSETPLMKKAKVDAIEWTMAINRQPPREQRSYVRDGYKWSEKPSVAQTAKGSSR